MQKPHIRHLREDRDVNGLIQALRYPEDPEIRARAARALGDISNLDAVESLMRSYLQDPNEKASQAAYDALRQMLGNDAETALEAYDPPNENWLQEDEDTVDEDDQDDLDEDDLDDENGMDHEAEKEPGAGQEKPENREVVWDENDIHGLMAIIRLDHSQKKRIKAIQALSQIENTQAIDALASIALWSEEKSLRQAAREALTNVYGEDLDAVLQSYRESNMAEDAKNTEEDEGDDDEEDDDEDYDEAEEDEEYGEDETNIDADEENDEEEAEVEKVNAGVIPSLEAPAYIPDRPSPYAHSTPPIHEETTSWVTYLLLGLLILVILAGVIYLLSK